MACGLAVIGAGSIGEKHAQAARAVGAELIYVVDQDRGRAENLAPKYGAAPVSDVEAAFGDPRVDGVVICVPNCFHRDLAIAAMRSGKDVLLEKPMALREVQCQEINDVARATARVLQIGFVHRYTAVGRLAKQIAAAGTLGDVYHAQAHLHLRRGVPGLGKWFTTKRLSGGGALIDVGVHLVDLALHVLGFPPIESVHGQVYAKFGARMDGYVYDNMWAGPPDHQGVFDVEDSAVAFVRFADGTTLDLQVAWAGNFPQASLPASMMGFFGERGGMTFELFGDHIQQVREQVRSVVDEKLVAPETDPFRDQLQDFLTGIETRQVCGPSGEQGQIVQSVVDAVYRSSLAPATTLVG